MRSVIIHLQDATANEVVQFLQSKYPFQQGPPWICDVAGDPCLFIDFYRDRLTEFEAEDLAALTTVLGKEPVISVIADVSGRHCGDEQVYSLVVTMLERFAGVAQDDYTQHYWICTEIKSGSRVQGRRFFDYTESSIAGASEVER